ncbi:tripartite tricarboxylate transporter TctB family protein [Bacillus shivajii]|uniref:tripartite tricarboxylate transporter TctB family protein n=1 Tax=Bacillus shivajii TaxID=1983719 RepID=UPI001CFAD101|nr:tripartite tricarboxylate transporter TctB family protein [Bacillus shivajii]UCZ53195.1 tripartite tricarboxylate transporter TctB family protein [Bacillus shivajii]
MGELLTGLFLFILSIIIYFQSGDFPSLNETHLNAGSFPKLIAMLLALLSLLLMIKKAKELIKKKAELSEMNVKDYLKELLIEYKLVFFTLIVLFLYISIMPFIGFIISTIIFIIVTGLVISSKKKKDSIILSVTAVVITLSAYFFFQNVLHVRFPSGLLF